METKSLYFIKYQVWHSENNFHGKSQFQCLLKLIFTFAILQLLFSRKYFCINDCTCDVTCVSRAIHLVRSCREKPIWSGFTYCFRVSHMCAGPEHNAFTSLVTRHVNFDVMPKCQIDRQAFFYLWWIICCVAVNKHSC